MGTTHFLNIGIDGAGSIQGSRVVNRALDEIGTKATQTDTQIKSVEKSLSNIGSNTNGIKSVKRDLDGVSTSTMNWGRMLETIEDRLIRIGVSTAVFMAIGRSISFITNGFREGIQAVDDFQTGIVQITAGLTQMAVVGGATNMAKAYKDSKVYAEALVLEMQKIDPMTMANSKGLMAMLQVMTAQGVVLDINNKKQVESFTDVSNAIATMTAGQDQQMQMFQETRALLSGDVNLHAQVSKNLDLQIKQQGIYKGGLKDVVALGREHGDLWERLSPYFKGLREASTDISQLWGSVKTSFETSVNVVQRAGFTSVVKDLVVLVNELNTYLKENAQIIGENITGAWKSVYGVITFLKDNFATLKIIFDELILAAQIWMGYLIKSAATALISSIQAHIAANIQLLDIEKKTQAAIIEGNAVAWDKTMGLKVQAAQMLSNAQVELEYATSKVAGLEADRVQMLSNIQVIESEKALQSQRIMSTINVKEDALLNVQAAEMKVMAARASIVMVEQELAANALHHNSQIQRIRDFGLEEIATEQLNIAMLEQEVIEKRLLGADVALTQAELDLSLMKDKHTLSVNRYNLAMERQAVLDTERKGMVGLTLAQDAELIAMKERLAVAQNSVTAAQERNMLVTMEQTTKWFTLGNAMNVLMAAWVGWEIGQFLNKFEIIRKAGVVMVYGIMGAWHQLETAWDRFKATMNPFGDESEQQAKLAKITTDYNAWMVTFKQNYKDQMKDVEQNPAIKAAASLVTAPLSNKYKEPEKKKKELKDILPYEAENAEMWSKGFDSITKEMEKFTKEYYKSINDTSIDAAEAWGKGFESMTKTMEKFFKDYYGAQQIAIEDQLAIVNSLESTYKISPDDASAQRIELYKQSIDLLKEQGDTGVDALKKIRTENEKIIEQQKKMFDRTAIGGMINAIEQYHIAASDVGAQIENAFTSAFNNIEDALTDFVTTGKLSFKSLFDQIKADLARMLIAKPITDYVGSALKGIVGNSLSGLFGSSSSTSSLGALSGGTTVGGSPILGAVNGGVSLLGTGAGLVGAGGLSLLGGGTAAAGTMGGIVSGASATTMASTGGYSLLAGGASTTAAASSMAIPIVGAVVAVGLIAKMIYDGAKAKREADRKIQEQSLAELKKINISLTAREESLAGNVYKGEQTAAVTAQKAEVMGIFTTMVQGLGRNYGEARKGDAWESIVNGTFESSQHATNQVAQQAYIAYNKLMTIQPQEIKNIIKKQEATTAGLKIQELELKGITSGTEYMKQLTLVREAADISLDRSINAEGDSAWSIQQRIYALQDEAKATDAAKEALDAKNAILETNRTLQQQLDVLTGKSTQLQIDRENERIGVTDASTLALMDQIDVQEDLRTAADKSAEAMKVLTDKMKDSLLVGLTQQQALEQAKIDVQSGALAQLSPEAAYNQAKSKFNTASVADMPTAAREFMEASKQYNASGAAFFADQQAILDKLNAASGNTGTTIDVARVQVTKLEDIRKLISDGNIDQRAYLASMTGGNAAINASLIAFIQSASGTTAATTATNTSTAAADAAAQAAAAQAAAAQAASETVRTAAALESFNNNFTSSYAYQVDEYTSPQEALDAYSGNFAQYLATANTNGYSFAKGTASVPFDMTAKIHQSEIIIDRKSADVLRKYGIPTTGSADNKETNELLKEEIRLLRALLNVSQASGTRIAEATEKTANATDGIERKARLNSNAPLGKAA